MGNNHEFNFKLGTVLAIGTLVIASPELWKWIKSLVSSDPDKRCEPHLTEKVAAVILCSVNLALAGFMLDRTLASPFGLEPSVIADSLLIQDFAAPALGTALVWMFPNERILRVIGWTLLLLNTIHIVYTFV